MAKVYDTYQKGTKKQYRIEIERQERFLFKAEPRYVITVNDLFVAATETLEEANDMVVEMVICNQLQNDECLC